MAKAGFKDKHKALKYEDVKINTNYAFTLNPSNKYQKFNSYTRPSEFLKIVNELLGNIKHYVLYPEISPKGRIHFHGWIWFDTQQEIIEFYLNKIHDLGENSTYEMDILNDVKIWTDYCTKQITFHEYFSRVTYTSIPLKSDFKSDHSGFMDDGKKKNKCISM